MDPVSAATPLLDYGVVGIVLVVFIVLFVMQIKQAQKDREKLGNEAREREDRLSVRLSQTEDYIRNTMGPVLDRNTEALAGNTVAMREMVELIKKHETDRHERRRLDHG